MSYSDGRFYTKQTAYLGELGLNASVTSVTVGMKAWSARKLTEVRGYITAAGTADASGWNIYNGTSSIGALVIGTATAGQFVDASLTDTTIAADGAIYLKNVNSDTQGTAMVTLEFQETFA
jgi:hypothetical protein